ncbi:Maternal effect embryo arrest protein [Rhynchospora pubera]|uniref:Maternal effect embryo arrest protein n=1 Tax=Rhynchospora pubera TaxID=906938 RepID=A0AAV8G5M0_9POAL|nr:Maternal effect embryo arrest protein [Rhynchospora pubera]
MESSVHNSSADAGKTSIHIMALDEMLGANSLATAAVLVGLSVAPTVVLGSNTQPSCNASHDQARNLIVFEVISFSFFLFSSLVTLGLKHAVHVINSKDQHEAFKTNVSLVIFKLAMIGSAIGSVIGGVFFFLSIAIVVQIKLCE